MFGFGNVSPWQLDILADPVQPFNTKQPELFGYIEAQPIPVLLIPEEEADNYTATFKVKGNYYLAIEPKENIIETNGCNTVLFKGTLDHDKVNAVASPNSYRSVGVYINSELSTNNMELLEELFIKQTAPFIDKSQARGDLLYLRHLDTPAYITPRLVEEVIEVVTFGN
jgi:hypothetical protein